MMRKVQRYGWIPDFPDHRDRIFRAEAPPTGIPIDVDLRPWFLAQAYDQGDLGSCTGNAWAAVMQYMAAKEGAPVETPSRLQIYYDERVLEGSPNDDSGAQIRDGAKVVASIGAAPESLWPYDISRFSVQPPPEVYAAAKKFEALEYLRVDNSDIWQVKGALAAGLPIVLGFSVFDSFESSDVTSSGIVPLPAPTEGMLGGHAVVCVGFCDGDKRFLCRNSWGPGWGMNGYFSIPYAYLTNTDLSADWWVVQKVSIPA